MAERRAAIPETCFTASLAADFGPGPEAVAEGCAAGRGACFLSLLPLTSGLAWRRRRRGCLCRPTRRVVCIPSSFRVADRFGPGPEAVAEGRASGQEFASLLLSQPTSGLARRRWRGLRSRVRCRLQVGWKDVLLPLALAGPAADLKNALLRSGPTPTAFDRAGWPGGSGWESVSCGCWLYLVQHFIFTVVISRKFGYRLRSKDWIVRPSFTPTNRLQLDRGTEQSGEPV